MTVTSQVLDAFKAKGLSEAKFALAQGQKQFVTTFSDYLEGQDVVLLGECFQDLVKAKANQLLATTAAEASDAQDEYTAGLNAIESLFLRYEIVGKAKLGVLARSFAHSLISGIFSVLGSVVQAGLTTLVPVAGGLGGAAINAGIQAVVHYFLGD